MADPLQFEDFKPSARPGCRQCEELLADAVDDLLSPADQAVFDRHIATCAGCMEALVDARRGAAWLHMIKTPRPEPSAHLLERILAATSGAESQSDQAGAETAGLAGFDNAARVFSPTGPAFTPRVLPFRPRAPKSQPVWHGLNRLLLEPRLAMTAAMAFFSIALTLNLAGVHLNQLHARDLGPSSIRRSYYEATASVSRRCEGLRVVHTVEARLDDVRQNDVRQDDVRQERPDADAAPEPAVPESRRDQPQRDEPRHRTPQQEEPALPAAAPAKPQLDAPDPEQSKPDQTKPHGDGLSMRAQPQAKPEALPLLDRKLIAVATISPVPPTHIEGGLA